MNTKLFTSLLKKYINEVTAKPRPSGGYEVSNDDGPEFIRKKDNTLWSKTLEGDFKCYSVFRAIRGSGAPVDPVEIIEALKNPIATGNLVTPQGTVKQVIETSLAAAWSEDPNNTLVNLDFGIVTTPQSSKTLGIKFAKAIADDFHVQLVPAMTLKDLSGAKIGDLPPTFSQKSAKGLERSLERMKSSGDPSIHRHFRPQDRKFVTDWQSMRGQQGEALMPGDRILIVDDVIADGSTMLEAKRTIERSTGATVVAGITIFRTGN